MSHTATTHSMPPMPVEEKRRHGSSPQMRRYHAASEGASARPFCKLSSVPEMTAEVPAPPLPAKRPELGRVGPYELREEIGRGGMATVFLAHDPRMGAPALVAVKRLHPHLSEDPALLEMFVDEARVAARIDHPNVCRVLDHGAHAGTPYLVMEYLVGRSLAWVREALRAQRHGAFDAAHAALTAHVVAEACEGLHAAHELRDDTGRRLEVVHRDVSLENIFLTRSGCAKVVDFGTVKSRAQRRDTAGDAMLGKMSYIAPEVLAGEAPDRRADIWGLGVVAWELLTGRLLFRRESTDETLRAILTGDILAPTRVRSRIPADYDEVVMRALSRDRHGRQASARELGTALRACASRTYGPVERADVALWLDELGVAKHAPEEAITVKMSPTLHRAS